MSNLQRVEPSSPLEGSRDSGFEGSRYSNGNVSSFASNNVPHQRDAWKYGTDLEEDGCMDTSAMTKNHDLYTGHGSHPEVKTRNQSYNQQQYHLQTLHDSGFVDSSYGITSNNELNNNLVQSCKIKQYLTREARLNSYKSFPHISEITHDAFVDAGLYFTGQNDKVKCAWCLGKLYNWLKGDNPMDEHARHFKECPYVREVKSKTESQLNVIREDKACSFTNSSFSSDSKCSPSKVDNSEIIKIVQQLGHDREVIEKAISVLTGKGVTDFKSAEILEEIFKLDDEAEESDSDSLLDGACGGCDEPQMNNIIRREAPHYAHGHMQPVYATAEFPSQSRNEIIGNDISKVISNDSIGNLSKQNDISKVGRLPDQVDRLNPLATNANNGVQMKSAHESQLRSDFGHTLGNEIEKLPENKTTVHTVKKVNMNDPQILKLAEERNKLRKNVICNVCNDAKIEVLFLPCRHMVACESCSSDINNCLRCSKKIVATVKIFML